MTVIKKLKKEGNSLFKVSFKIDQGVHLDYEIQGTGTVEFEDDLKMGVLPGGCWCPCGDRT